MPDDILLFSFINWCPTQLLSERHHPATDGNRCRYPQPHIWQSLWNSTEEGEEGLQESEVSGIPQENLQNQQTWTHRGTLTLNQQSGSLHGSNTDLLYICYSYVAWCFCGTPTEKVELVSDALWIPCPLLGCLVQPHEGK